MLSIQRLRESLRPLFTPGTMPGKDAATRWLSAYTAYANDAVAGVTQLAAPLVPREVTGDFLVGLDGALMSTWMNAAWVSLGATGVTTFVPPFAPYLLSSSAVLLRRSTDPQQALTAIAQSIHTYTLSITVTVTTASGVTTVVPLA